MSPAPPGSTPRVTPLCVGFALSGGAARGLFHIGALRALDEGGIRPDILAGSSAGALVASARAAGVCLSDVERLVSRIQWQMDILDVRSSLVAGFGRICERLAGVGRRIPPGLLQNLRVPRTLAMLTAGRTFSEILPLIITGADIESGERIYFCSPRTADRFPVRRSDVGHATEVAWRRIHAPDPVVVPFEDVGLAARVSSCIPILMESIALSLTDRDGVTRRRLLNDGGVLDHIPVEPLRKVGCRRILAIHLGYVPYTRSVRSIKDQILNSVHALALAQMSRSLDRADYVLHDPRIETTSFHVFDPALVEMGYEFTRARLPRIREALGLAGDGIARARAS